MNILEGYWWPGLKEDVVKFMAACEHYNSLFKPIPHATLYHFNMVSKWSDNIVEYLQMGVVNDSMPKHRQRAMLIDAKIYSFVGDHLYKRGQDGKLRLCVCENEYLPILNQAHGGIDSGHFSGETTARNIIWSGLWCSTLYHDAQEYIKRCDQCQRSKTPTMFDNMPLQPMMSTRAFAKCGIDFVGPIKPPA